MTKEKTATAGGQMMELAEMLYSAKGWMNPADVAKMEKEMDARVAALQARVAKLQAALEANGLTEND